jgi:hypothetical protein
VFTIASSNVTAILSHDHQCKMYFLTIMITFSKLCPPGIVLCDQEILTLFRELDTAKAVAIKVSEILQYLV